MLSGTQGKVRFSHNMIPPVIDHCGQGVPKLIGRIVGISGAQLDLCNFFLLKKKVHFSQYFSILYPTLCGL